MAMIAHSPDEACAGGVTDYTVDGRCSNCGACCSCMLPLSKVDIAEIKKYVKKHRIKPVRHLPSLITGNSFDMVCPFRDEERKCCIIYDARPTVCRVFKCDYSKDNLIREAANNRLLTGKIKTYDIFDVIYGRKPEDRLISVAMLVKHMEVANDYVKCHSESLKRIAKGIRR